MSTTLLPALAVTANPLIAPLPLAPPSLVPPIERRQAGYQLRLASSEKDREAACRLRFLVFNLELNEGLESAYSSGLDTDEFDAQCDHLLVEHVASGRVVGTYRLQTAAAARTNRGFYSEQEFRFDPYYALGESVIELGRACIHRDHRGGAPLELLWKGIFSYAVQRGGRYLIGCSSLTSQNAAHGTNVYERLLDYQAEPALRTVPQAAFDMPLAHDSAAGDDVPKLLRTYLAIGAKICGPPAIDREFKTIDFLTLLDLESLHPRIRTRFMSS
jgi:putative hemolysin